MMVVIRIMVIMIICYLSDQEKIIQIYEQLLKIQMFKKKNMRLSKMYNL